MNNYDNNSKGLSIECYTRYDTESSQFAFKDNISILKHQSYSQICIAFFHGQGKDHDDIEFTVKGTKAEMVRFLWQEGEYWYRNKTELNRKTKADLIEDIFEFFRHDINDINVLTIDELNDYFNPVLNSSQLDFCEKTNQDPNDFKLEIVPVGVTIEAIETRGYCQGDYAKVYYCPEFIESYLGNLPREKNLKNQIDNLFWDSPVCARAEIDGDEYYYDDLPGIDAYDWDRDAWIKYLSKETGIDKREFEPLIPEYPDCN